jgi:predicted  nucleic acid-binding Zn-ribbon protein
MELLTIVYVAMALIIGAGATYLLLRNKKPEKVDDLNEKKQEEEKDLLIKECEQKVWESEARAAELKKRYETLLAESEKQIVELDAQKKQLFEGKVDDSIINEQFVEVDKLKKKIKELQDDLDDAEDDNETLEKKLKKLSDENRDLEEKISMSKQEINQLREKMERIQEELNEKTDELNLKIDSLAFIQEVLTANKSSNDADRDLYRKVDLIVDYIKGELKDCVKETPLGSNEAMFNDDLYRWANLQKKSWIQGKITVAFVGEFSAGKTSIVNRILSQDNPNIPQLPVSTKATTAIPTYISGGVSTRYEFVAPDHTLKNISENTFRKVRKEVLDQVKGVSSLISYFVMSYKNKNLNNLSILDTPGFSSNDSEDAERTIDVINECDALFWVFDVNNGTINKSSISLIKKHLKKPLYVVINKTDTKANPEINSVEKLISKTLQNEGVEVQSFIRFSAKSDISVIINPIKTIAKDSNKNTYIDSLMSSLNELERVSEKEKNDLYNQYKKKFEKGEKIEQKYKDAIIALKNSCDEASDMPQWTTHFFSKDRYEMSKSEYEEMDNLLDNIANKQVSQMKKMFENYGEVTQEIQKAFSDYLNKYHSNERISNSIKHIKHSINSLKK